MQNAITEEVKPFDEASKYKVGIVCAQFNTHITGKILDNALATLKEYNVNEKNIDIEYVAGAVEIPIAAKILAEKNTYNCLIAIGAIIKGETDHYHVVIKMASEGIMRVMLDHTLPIGLALLTTENEKMAMERVSIGGDAAKAALHVARKK